MRKQIKYWEEQQDLPIGKLIINGKMAFTIKLDPATCNATNHFGLNEQERLPAKQGINASKHSVIRRSPKITQTTRETTSSK